MRVSETAMMMPPSNTHSDQLSVVWSESDVYGVTSSIETMARR